MVQNKRYYKANPNRDYSKRKRRGAGFLSSFLVFLGVLSFVYGIMVVLTIGSSHWFNFAGMIVAAGLFLLAFLYSRNLGMPAILKILVSIIVIACLTNFGIFVYHMHQASTKPLPKEEPKWVIVLGAKVNGTQPSRELQARIEAAANYFRSTASYSVKGDQAWPKLIAAGGQGDDEEVPEGEVIARVATSLGVPANHILIDSESMTTQENFQMARKIIEANGGSVKDSVLIVTSGFHIYRAEKLAAMEGFENISSLGSRGKLSLLPHYIAREYAAMIKGVTNGSLPGNPLPFGR